MQVELKYFMFIYCIMSIFRNGKKNKIKNSLNACYNKFCNYIFRRLLSLILPPN